jgi:hypothetical protein
MGSLPEPPPPSALRRPAGAEISIEAAALGAVFPALAHLLGPAAFRALCEVAVQRAACAPGAAPGLASAAAHGAAPGAKIHSLLVRREARTDDRLPSRLAADIAALEWSIHTVAARAADGSDLRRAGPHDVPSLLPPGAPKPAGSAWRSAALQPARAFDIVRVAFRLDTWVRRLHEGRRVGRLPVRDEQHIVVSAPARPAQQAGAPPASACWFALPPGRGQLLTRLALGVPLGEALRDAVRRGWVRDESEARELVGSWLREGLFARVLHSGG